jgi:P-type Ca2+ transporter type 2C
MENLTKNFTNRLWYKTSVEETAQVLQTDAANGLSDREAARRLQEFGANELVETGAKSPWRILWEQLTSVMVLILVGAVVISALVGDWKDAGVIAAIVVLFAALGFIQEYRAERAMAALKKLAVPLVRIRRGGAVKEVSARELVPGDIVLLEAGNKIPADCRVIESANLRVEEAALTGESEPVEKEAAAIDAENPPLGDRRNMVYMGTAVTFGRGAAVVTATGMQTELGRIAGMIQNVERETTPLQKRLDQLGKAIGVIAVVVAGIIFGLGVWRGEELSLMIMTMVSVAVAAVPEGLPAVVTITLALGAQRMLRRQALIRKLPAVETLGSVTTICSDKTGTLTENRMTVTVLDVAGRRLDLSESATREIVKGEKMNDAEIAALDPAIQLLLTSSALCSDALLREDAGAREFSALGDPTEGALVVAAAKAGIFKAEIEQAMPRVAEFPFDSERKRMTTIHRFPKDLNAVPKDLRTTLNGYLQKPQDAPFVAFVKGSVDGLLDLSAKVWQNGRAETMTAKWRERIEQSNNELAQNGMRVLGVGMRWLDSLDAAKAVEKIEGELIFVGLVGMIDPPRAEVREAVAKCKTAGIKTVMITGDHPLTAAYIARDLGIADANSKTVTGQELDKMTDEALREIVEETAVFARVSPEHKFRIVAALQERGHIVSMTGDGVNDAPALKKANIGVAMGITGTDVSKEAAEMVLRDDNFATIVAAVEEGRTIYDNLKKFIKFSIAGNIGKVLTVLVGPLTGMPLTLLPLQLLWLNLLTDGLLGLGLGVEKSERNVMKRPPHLPSESIFARGMSRHIAWAGLFMFAGALGVGYFYWASGFQQWQTMTFTTLAFMQIGHAFGIRSTHDSLFSIGLTTNKLLLAMGALVFALQIAVLYVPLLQTMFGTQALSFADFMICLGIGAALFAAVELEKWLTRRGESEIFRGESRQTATA